MRSFKSRGEANLVRLLQENNQDAWRNLWEEYYPRVMGIISKKIPEEDREDVVQEVFIAIYKNICRLRGQKLKGWIYQIAKNKIADYFRQRRLPMGSLEDPEATNGEEEGRPMGDSIPSNEPTPEESVLAREEIKEVLGELPPDQRRCIILDAGGWTQQEIADILGKSPGTVASWIHRARKKINARLAETL
jgi:RNA polymerase sigma-70 factor (ECF subfamily)